MGNDIEISLNVANQYETNCDTRSKYNSIGEVFGKNYVMFQMKFIEGNSQFKAF